jgi:hypothetical protein
MHASNNDFLKLSAPHAGSPIEAIAVLKDNVHHLKSRRLGQTLQLGEAAPGSATISERHPD